MHHCDDHDLPRFDPVVNDIGESVDRPLAEVFMGERIPLRAISDLLEYPVHLFDELRPEADSLLVVPVRGRIDFALGDPS